MIRSLGLAVSSRRRTGRLDVPKTPIKRYLVEDSERYAAGATYGPRSENEAYNLKWQWSILTRYATGKSVKHLCGLVFDSSPVTECHCQPEHPAHLLSVRPAYHGRFDSRSNCHIALLARKTASG
jgi:hypothetical protein